MKPLFIPLKAEYYQAFATSNKNVEIRLYGPRWNEKTCTVGRQVVISKGYGKQSRMTGEIALFMKTHGTLLNPENKQAVLNVYATLDVVVAVIGITKLKKLEKTL